MIPVTTASLVYVAAAVVRSRTLGSSGIIRVMKVIRGIRVIRIIRVIRVIRVIKVISIAKKRLVALFVFALTSRGLVGW